MTTVKTQQQSSAHPQSLKAAYASAEAQRKAIERGVFPNGGGLASGSGSGNNDSRAAYGDAVTKALEAYEDCSKKVEALSLFSTNESLEDISTPHLPYLLVPYRVAELVQRVPAAGGPADRQKILKRARASYERFLHRLGAYEGLLSEGYTKLLQEYTDDPTHFSTVGNTGTGAGTTRGGGAAAALMDPSTRRNAKIANFRTEKELRTKLEVLQRRQAERRERQRRQRQRIRAAEGIEEEGEQEEDDDADDDDEDEETARELYVAEISYCTHLAFQALESLNREDEMLAQVAAMATSRGWPSAGSSNSSAGGLGDSRQRQAGRDGTFTERLEPIGAPTGDALRRLQSTFGNTVGTGALLTKEGKPRQPFTILGSRAEMAKGVFRPGHNLPTMSIDEYLEEERKRGGIIEGGGPSSGLKPEPDEDNHEAADAETMKARAWDEFTEANPKGTGNTLNRG